MTLHRQRRPVSWWLVSGVLFVAMSQASLLLDSQRSLRPLNVWVGVAVIVVSLSLLVYELWRRDPH